MLHVSPTRTVRKYVQSLFDHYEPGSHPRPLAKPQFRPRLSGLRHWCCAVRWPALHLQVAYFGQYQPVWTRQPRCGVSLANRNSAQLPAGPIPGPNGARPWTRPPAKKTTAQPVSIRSRTVQCAPHIHGGKSSTSNVPSVRVRAKSQRLIDKSIASEGAPSWSDGLSLRIFFKNRHEAWRQRACALQRCVVRARARS
ncbi:hypothetical protein V1289_009695 [Bradyrhizobium sp. AZCC 2289]